MAHSTNVPWAAAQEELNKLAELAWRAREGAYVLGNTKVGCALVSDLGNVFSGCNVEHKFRSHDVHAEVNAITTMIASGSQRIVALIVVAERDQFTPCGACMDWIMQFATDACIVGFQGRKGGPIATYTTKELMPFYPK